MAEFNYHNRFFAGVANSETGEVSSDTVFHYRQQGDIVWATYEGGGIRFGTLVATVDAAGCLEMRYQHVNQEGALCTGQCFSTPEVLPDGRYRLHERWQWTSGDFSMGSSVVEEINPRGIEFSHAANRQRNRDLQSRLQTQSGSDDDCRRDRYDLRLFDAVGDSALKLDPAG